MKSDSDGELDPLEWRLWMIEERDRRAAWVYEFGRELLKREAGIDRLPLLGGIDRRSAPWRGLDAGTRNTLRQLAACEVGVECFGREVNPDFLGPQAAKLYPFGLNARAAYFRDQETLAEHDLTKGPLRARCVEGFSLAVNWQWPLARIIEAIKSELQYRETRLTITGGLPLGRGEFGIAGRASWGENLIRLGQARLLLHARELGKKQAREWSKDWWDFAVKETMGTRKGRALGSIPKKTTGKDFTRADGAVKIILKKFCHFHSDKVAP